MPFVTVRYCRTNAVVASEEDVRAFAAKIASDVDIECDEAELSEYVSNDEVQTEVSKLKEAYEEAIISKALSAWEAFREDAVS